MRSEALFIAFLEGLDPARLATLARRYQTLAFQEGAYVTLTDGVQLAIPPILTPIVVKRDEQNVLARDARSLVSALSRATRSLLAGKEHQLRAMLLGPLSTFEREAMDRTYLDAEQLATARVDFLVGVDGAARALEVNATIPAMQGYSDAMAAAFLRAVGELRGVAAEKIDEAIDANGRNSDDLLASLINKHARVTGRPLDGRPRSIAIVARPGDAQSGELDHYVRRWRALGHEVERVTPDQIVRAADGIVAAGRKPDLVYRHIFLRRIDPTSDLAQILLSPSAYRIWNPPASHLELKGMLGLLSMGASGDEAAAKIGLTIEERETIVRRLPWTRLLVPGATHGPDGETIADLIAFTRENAAQLVVKRSWDYGGRGVFLGAELDDEGSQGRLRELMGVGEGPIGWGALIDHIERSGEAWVVQALVEVEPRLMLRVDDTGPQWRSLFADLSAFTSLGDGAEMSGGAVRASGGRIVNIQGGGGLAPLIREDALARVLEGLA